MRTLWTGAAVLMSLALWAADGVADPALPAYLGHGFPLDRFDPAPAGDPFVWTPSALAPTGESLQLGYDVAIRPLRIEAANAPSQSTSGATYLHVGGAVVPFDHFVLSADVPMLMAQRLYVGTPVSATGYASPAINPEAGDLGDIRLGLRWGAPLVPWNQAAIAFAVDYWFATGNPQTLTGDDVPSNAAWRNRKDLLVIVSGFAGMFDYAGSVGYEDRPTYAFDGSAVGRGVPFRLAGAIHQGDDTSLKIREALEVIFEPMFPTEDASFSKSTFSEAMLSFQAMTPLTYGRVTAGLGVGSGLAQAPGVATARALFWLTYTTTDRDGGRVR